MKNNHSFTLIELIITIILMAIVMIPLGALSMEFMRAIPYAQSLGLAQGLARLELAKVNNLDFASVEDYTGANYEGYPYDLYRTVATVAGSSNNLKQVQVKVFKAGNTNNSLVNLITYVGNNAAIGSTFAFGAGSAPACGPTKAKALAVQGGSIFGASLVNVVLKNICTTPITITGIKVAFTRSGGGSIRLRTINIGGGPQEWNGNVSSPASVTFTTSFTLAANSSYNSPTLLNFQHNLTNPGGIVSLVFLMSDGSSSSSYSW